MRLHLAHLTPLCLALALSACASMGDGASRLTAPVPAVATLVPMPDSSGRTMHMVCASTIDPTRHPLFVVDHRIVDGADLKITPSEIETLEVLKGPAAVAIYGSRATDGALVITTYGATHRGSGPRP